MTSLPKQPDYSYIRAKCRQKEQALTDSFAKEIVKSLIHKFPDMTPKDLAEKSYAIAEEMMLAREL